MKYLKLFEESSDDILWHVISHIDYLHYLDDIVHIDKEVDKIKSIILNHKPDAEIKITNAYIKALIKYNYHISGEMKIYLLPDDWYLVSFVKNFKVSKTHSYYKCDQLEGLKELIEWI